MNTPHDHDHNDMTPYDHALAHNKQLTQQLEEVKSDLEFRRDLYALQTKQLEKVWRDLAAITKDRDLWKAETKRWRDMYIEYDEMLEGDLEKAKKRITNVISKIKSLEKEMNDEKY
jgi:chromosome segregation ATPase